MNAEVMLVPSAFTRPTGEAHWELLLRARAVETQSYVVAAAQCGVHSEGRASYGHAVVIDPWGRLWRNSRIRTRGWESRSRRWTSRTSTTCARGYPWRRTERPLGEFETSVATAPGEVT